MLRYRMQFNAIGSAFQEFGGHGLVVGRSLPDVPLPESPHESSQSYRAKNKPQGME